MQLGEDMTTVVQLGLTETIDEIRQPAAEVIYNHASLLQELYHGLRLSLDVTLRFAVRDEVKDASW